jgi:hypothetical protein
MEEILLIPESEIISGKKTRSKMTGLYLTREQESENPFIDFLISEGGEIFFNYLSRLGHSFKPNMMLLSSRRNYYYDYSDLNGVTTVINLRRLNRVPHLESFISTISAATASGTCFAGCFSNCKTKNLSGLSPSMNRKNNRHTELATETELDQDKMIRLLDSCRFKVYDMTEINGLTYFLATKK